MHALLAASALAVGLIAASPAVNATVVMSSSVGGTPTAGHYESFDSLPLGTVGGTTASGITVAFNPGAHAVQGTTGTYAAPFVSHGNATMFGEQTYSGAVKNTYLASGNSSAANVTMTFGGQQNYFGLLWGSVDWFNTLTFYSNGILVTSFDGTDVSNSAGAGNCVGGDQGALGTCYVNINFLTGSYDKVVASSSSYSFEFDNVAFSAFATAVPEPGALGLMGLGLLTLGGLAMRRRKFLIK
ncbi:MAG: PEP-CTERM sorting domain-containing protein [Rhodanobacter sp.]